MLSPKSIWSCTFRGIIFTHTSAFVEYLCSKSLTNGRLGAARPSGDVANPWLLVDRAALQETVATIKTMAAKHGGSYVEVQQRERKHQTRIN